MRPIFKVLLSVNGIANFPSLLKAKPVEEVAVSDNYADDYATNYTAVTPEIYADNYADNYTAPA